MFGLGAYESSSEDERNEKHQPKTKDAKASDRKSQLVPRASPDIGPSPNPTSSTEPSTQPLVGPFNPHRSPPAPGESSESRSCSPYSEARNLIHNMTLPPIPNLDIPPSPPGSPNAAANQKISHFLSLKKQGVHFNEKLVASSSLKNPSLLDKLMEHAGIDGQAQYATSLPGDLWDVSILPPWGFKEELQSSQLETRRKIEEKKSTGQRESIDFVPGNGSGDSSRAGTPSGGKGRSIAAERVVANASRGKANPRPVNETGKRGDLERRPKRLELGRKRDHSRSPSTRRKRSRSR